MSRKRKNLNHQQGRTGQVSPQSKAQTQNNPELEASLEKLEKQRRLALLAPVIAVPLITLLFFLMGGGQAGSQTEAESEGTGLNTFVPEAAVDSTAAELSKQETYEKARQDSVRRAKQLALSDYLYEYDELAEQADEEAQTESASTRPPTGLNTDAYRPLSKKQMPEGDSATRALQAELNSFYEGYPGYDEGASFDQTSAKLDQLIQLVEMQLKMQAEREERQMEEALLGGKREMDTLHAPEREVETIIEVPSGRREVVSYLPPKAEADSDSISETPTQNRFYGTATNSKVVMHNTIKAVIHQDQVVMSGSTVKMRLLTDIEVNGRLIPRGTLIFGTVQLSGERASIQIKGLHYDQNLYEVALEAYGVDGLPGLHIPGSMTREAARDLATDTSDELPAETALEGAGGVPGQVAGSVIKTGKSLFSKRVKLQKVTLKAGTQLLLI
ncbi:MAG: conjugative transposon protein TraM [Bacteroidia bacterium]|nr:conjugative transposon protein TraM [Bacteroidia bacterium]